MCTSVVVIKERHDHIHPSTLSSPSSLEKKWYHQRHSVIFHGQLEHSPLMATLTSVFVCQLTYPLPARSHREISSISSTKSDICRLCFCSPDLPFLAPPSLLDSVVGRQRGWAGREDEVQLIRSDLLGCCVCPSLYRTYKRQDWETSQKKFCKNTMCYTPTQVRSIIKKSSGDIQE